MQRTAFKIHLKPGMQEEYKKRHDGLWPEMKELLRKAGIRNYSIWNEGEDIFGYYEAEDLQKSNDILASSEVNARWDAYMEDIIDFIPDIDGNPKPIKLMFYFNC